MQCIILSGGLGTRLRTVVPDLPKSMANIDGKPFLWYLIKYLQRQGVTQFVFALGYKHEVIEDYLAGESSPFYQQKMNYQISVEREPLGTGGAVWNALKLVTTEHIFVVNGDTLFDVNLEEMKSIHNDKKALCTLALKPMNDFERYGVVAVKKDAQVLQFKEKQHYEEGNINGGIYLMNVAPFLSLTFPEKFSFEKDFLEIQAQCHTLYASIQKKYFIDIGIPADFERAQKELPQLFSSGLNA